MGTNFRGQGVVGVVLRGFLSKKPRHILMKNVKIVTRSFLDIETLGKEAEFIHFYYYANSSRCTKPTYVDIN